MWSLSSNSCRPAPAAATAICSFDLSVPGTMSAIDPDTSISASTETRWVSSRQTAWAAAGPSGERTGSGWSALVLSPLSPAVSSASAVPLARRSP
jgi:hypothetical protein